MPDKPRAYKPIGHKSYDQRRREQYAASGGRPYDKAAWRKESKLKRQESPLCEDCLAKNMIEPATQVHHINKLASGGELLDSETMSLCRRCHMERTKRGE